MSSDTPQHEDSYQRYHIALIHNLVKYIKQHSPFDQSGVDALTTTDAEFLALVNGLLDSNMPIDQRNHTGQSVLQRIVASYQDIMPVVPRGLFWYFGGDCLHYLGDEEIAHFQRLEEAYHELLTEDPPGADYEQLVKMMYGDGPGLLN